MRTTIYYCLSLLLLTTTVCGQNTVFVGDANANGKVDQYDIPYIGYAFNATGPTRIQTETTSPQGIAQLWNGSFPGGPNFIHADSDGNGVVTIADFVLWNNNYGWEAPVVESIPLSDDQVDSPNAIVLNNGMNPIPVTGNTALTIPIDFLLPADQTVNGIAFTLRYEPGHFSFANYSSQDSWLTLDGNGISFDRETPGYVNVGATRFGVSPVNGGGSGGTMNLIVIGDMVDLLESPDDTLTTYVYFEDILVLDENFQAVSISADSLEIKLFSPQPITNTQDIANPLQAQVFPNPSNGQFQLTSELPFTDLLLYNSVGQIVHQEQQSERYQWNPASLDLLAGLYTLELRNRTTSNMSSMLRIIIQ